MPKQQNLTFNTLHKTSVNSSKKAVTIDAYSVLYLDKCSATFEVLSSETVNVVTSTKKSSLLAGVQAFPNPFRESLIISLPQLDHEVKVTVLDALTGQEKKTAVFNSGETHHLNTEELPAGIYLLRLSTDDMHQTIPLIKQ